MKYDKTVQAVHDDYYAAKDRYMETSRLMLEFAHRVYVLNGGTETRGWSQDDATGFELNDGIVTVFTEYHSRGEDYYENHSFPLSYMTDPDWRDKEIAAAQERKERHKKRIEAKELENSAASKELRRQQYLKLKAEFE